MWCRRKLPDPHEGSKDLMKVFGSVSPSLFRRPSSVRTSVKSVIHARFSSLCQLSNISKTIPVSLGRPEDVACSKGEKHKMSAVVDDV